MKQCLPKPLLVIMLLICLLTVQHVGHPLRLLAQGDPTVESPVDDASVSDEVLPAPARVDVEPRAEDAAITERLTTILRATEWFQAPTVDVRDGVAFLDGRTTRTQYKEWAGDLARNTQDVVAVVNRIQVVEPLTWDLSPAITELRSLGRGFLRTFPLFILGAIILVIAWFLAKFLGVLIYNALGKRVMSALLRRVLAGAVSVPIILIGLYIVLQISGLTRLAVTVLGGTGLAGLIVGIAFRDIMENFLASILISVRNPFRTGDRIQVADYLGIVQQVTTRGTVLMTLDGNHVQIPNATIYKSNIVNYTANPRRRLAFGIGIGYDDVIADAQELILGLLQSHPTLLREPEPLVLVESLGSSTVNLRVFFWINNVEHDELKVKSSVIRLVKRGLMDAGFSMPDEAREVIFPQGVPLHSMGRQPTQSDHANQGLNGQRACEEPVTAEVRKETTTAEPLSTAAEGNLRSDDEQIREQARETVSPEGEENLLDSDLS